MKKQKMLSIFKTIFLCGLILVFISSCTGSTDSSKLQAKVDSLEKELSRFNAEEAMTNKRITRFDSLDFDFYNNQKWDSFAISHANDIKVYYPDGTITEGLTPKHIDMVKPMFVFAPDTRIRTHPVKFGNGDWTAVIGEMDGTFTQPMPIGNGKTISPTGKKFKLTVCTIGHWNGEKMSEEYLFWDNQLFMKQLGLAQ